MTSQSQPNCQHRWINQLLVAAIALVVAVAAPSGSTYGAGASSGKYKSSQRANYKIQEAGDVSYVRLEIMTLSIFEDFKIRARIALGLDLETKKGDETKVTKYLPRLQAKYTEFISQRGAPAIKRGKLRVRFLRNSLQKITDKTLGKGVATVLIREAVKL